VEFVEKVTEALRAAVAGKDYVWHDSEPGETSVAIDGVVDIRDLARAAIAAMREPTPWMIAAGDEAYETFQPMYPSVVVYNAMIDAALEPKEK
jgi:hypothetical protein